MNQFVRAYSPADNVIELTDDTRTDPFLSVLVRTQGRRRSTLIETLLSLAAQTSQDFEVLILAHDMKEADLAELDLLVESFDGELSEKVRIVRVEGGGRARPLNAGVQKARGKYLAVLDDDDIAFAQWVEAFHKSRVGQPWDRHSHPGR